jgi:hypothetical protein
MLGSWSLLWNVETWRRLRSEDCDDPSGAQEPVALFTTDAPAACHVRTAEMAEAKDKPVIA